jgi:hypothetical protein
VITDPQVVERLELIQATLQMAFKPELDQARKLIRADSVNAAILDETEDWIPSKNLQDRVAKKADTSARTVRARLPELVEQRVLASRGTERALEYRRTGLI